MAEQFHIVPPNELPFDPKRKNSRANYPWADLDVGHGFVFRSGTSYFYARNQCSFYGRQLGRQFRATEVVETGLIWATRVDGLDYIPGRMGDGTKVRQVTQRMEFLPSHDNWEEYQDRMARDAQIERLKEVFDKLPYTDLTAFVDDLITQITAIAAKKAAQAAMASEDDGEVPFEEPDVI